MKTRIGQFVALVIGASVVMGPAAASETPEEWVKLGARVHGGFGAFIPLGIRIGLDAAQTLKASPRQLSVTYYDNPKAPCACFADGIAIATVSSVGQRNLRIATEPAKEDAAAVIIIRPRQGGPGLRYEIPMQALPRLAEMNKTLEPLQRYHAVMKADGLFTRADEP
jgi:formylmethanofuran dehydrogenase subunit E